MFAKTKTGGFTLIELLVVISIIALLATIVLVSLNTARKKGRDARRLADVHQIILALEMYYDANDQYPNNSDNDCSGWDAGYNGGPGSGDPFIQPLVTDEYMSVVPGDPKDTGNCGGYCYYIYSAGSYNCDSSNGRFYVLGVRDMETSGRPHPESPGWSCPNRDWESEFDWVTGGFEY